MNVKGLLGFAALSAAALYFLSRKKQFVKSAVFTFEKLDFDLKKKKILVKLGILNPTGQTATINSVVGNLSVNGSPIATVENFEKMNISATGKSFLNLKLSPSVAGIWTVLKNFVKAKFKGTGKSTAIFTGTANVNGVSIPINTKLL